MSKKTIFRGNVPKQEPVTQTSETAEAERAAQESGAAPVSEAQVPNAPMPEPPVPIRELATDAAALVKPAAKVVKPQTWLDQHLNKKHVHAWDKPAAPTKGKD